MSTAVMIENLVKTYAPGTPPAVDGVTLTIEPGELGFLLGPSGCGKTTLLRMVAGFFDPTAGKIIFGTPSGLRDVTHLAPNKRNTGMVFQSYALWPHMTVAQNVGFGLEIRKVPAADRKRRIAEALEMVQMAPYAERKTNALSGGQQQRVALARALVIRPDVLLLDEPLSNLDARLRIDLRAEIRRICKSSGITTIYVTHDQKEALSMADRVAIMRAGKLVQSGPPEDLYRRPATRFVAEFLGETNFITGRITGSDARGTTVATSFGTLISATAWNGSPDVTLSLRPEALRTTSEPGTSLSDSGNILYAHVRERTYLGELAQISAHLIAADEATTAATPSAETSIKVSLLNPPPAGIVGQRIALCIDPLDVVIVGS